jgi:hypothetical protein
VRNILKASLLGAIYLFVLPCCARGAIFAGTLGPSEGTQSFTFSGESNGGVGSARLDVTVSETGGITTVVADIWNTSPTTYGSGQTNLSAITGFGFDVTPDKPFFTYSIVARQWNGSSFTDVVLGDTDPAGNLWNLKQDGGSGQLKVDMFADNGTGVAEALYNPELAGDTAIGNTSPFFTEAQLTISFLGPLEVKWAYSDQPGYEGNGSYATPIVRMQRVGSGGSLKLEPDGPPSVVPEPHSVIIWTLAGGVGMLMASRRRKKAATA